MKIIDVEVAVGFTDGTWSSVMMRIGKKTPRPFLSDSAIEKEAEDRVLRDFSGGVRPVAFVKTIWIDPGEEE